MNCKNYMGTITVNNLGKAYKQYPNRWARLEEWIVPGNRRRHTLNWVLQDVNFNVQPGEAVGIIGINGAGKSTLLKMITGTTEPTTGSVSVTGRVAALLELGMGFHPDFTGRQNAYMAGQLLGMSMKEISQLMPEIESFAEIGDYFDQPIRIYSSGMQMRVAFSVATARRPDVLIVDEAMSVGDAFFQNKSFERIKECRKQGTTLLIVSHDKGAIQSICDRAILLDAGKLAKEGYPEEIMDYYNALIAKKENSEISFRKTDTGRVQTISGSGAIDIESISILNEKNETIEVVSVGELITLDIIAIVRSCISDLVIGYLIKDRLGNPIFGTNTSQMGDRMTKTEVGQHVNFKFKFPANMGEGAYSISIAFHSSETHMQQNHLWKDRATMFNVINLDKKPFYGVAWIPPELNIQNGQ